MIQPFKKFFPFLPLTVIVAACSASDKLASVKVPARLKGDFYIAKNVKVNINEWGANSLAHMLSAENMRDLQRRGSKKFNTLSRLKPYYESGKLKQITFVPYLLDTTTGQEKNLTPYVIRNDFYCISPAVPSHWAKVIDADMKEATTVQSVRRPRSIQEWSIPLGKGLCESLWN